MELEDMVIENIQNKTHKEKRIQKMKDFSEP